MNLRPNRHISQLRLLIGTACAFSILLSLTSDAMAQCQNRGGQSGGNQPRMNLSNAGTGFQSGNLSQFGQNSQQSMVQQMLQAQLMNMLMQQAQQQTAPQSFPFNRFAQQTDRTNPDFANQTTQIQTPPPRDPDKPLTKKEKLLEALREKERIKREEYQARIAAREQKLNDLKARIDLQ